MDYVVVIRYEAVPEDIVIVEANSKEEARYNALNRINMVDVVETNITKSRTEVGITYCEKA